MRIYAAASTSKSGGGYDRVLEAVAYPSVLIAFPYDPNGTYIDTPADGVGITYLPDSVLTDSGAFTVWKSGGAVDLGAYIDYCGQVRERLPDGHDLLHVNLDVMPGEFGRLPTEAERRAGMRKSLKNADRMRKAGLPVMEVYHQYEPIEFLHELLDRRQPGDRIGISPRNDAATSVRRRFCDGVFHVLLERHGRAIPPCHGLGVGSRELIWRYPWWSVDAISWIVPGTFGRTMTRRGVTEIAKTRDRAVRHHECAEFLRVWRKWSDELTRLWAQRGVTWLT